MPRCRRRTTPSMRRRAKSCSTTARSPTRSSSPPRAGARLGGGGDRDGRPVPRLCRRSVRHGVAVSRLGARAVRRGEGRQAAEAARAAGRPADDDRPVGPCEVRHRADRRRPPGDGHGLAAAHAARAALDVVHARAALTGSGREDDHLWRRRLADGFRARRGAACRWKRRPPPRSGRRSATCCSTARARSRPSSSRRWRRSTGSSSGTVRAGLAKIAVAPRVDAQVTAAGARGTIRPALAGAPVQLQQQSGTGGRRSRPASPTPRGAFSFAQALATGTYRVRCVPGHGLAAGLSAPIAVP